MVSILLPASVLALGVGPLIIRATNSRPGVLAFLDGFVLVTIGGLVLLEVIPNAMLTRDLSAGFFLILGFALPTLAERLFRFGVSKTHAIVLSLAMVGLAAHSALDGSALAQAAHSSTRMIGIGVLLHQLPVSMMVWLLMSDWRRRYTWLVLGLMGFSTVIGYAVEPQVLRLLPPYGAVWFTALVGGSLLHVVAHPAISLRQRAPRVTGAHAHDHQAAPHCCTGDAHTHTNALESGYSGLGALAGMMVLVIAYAARGGTTGSGPQLLATIWNTFRMLALESAPAVLLAYVAAGLVHAYATPSSMRWLSRGSRVRQSVAGMLVGLPLPICSCGVVPLYQGLIRQGVSTTAAIAFLIATPELGLDAILLSVPLLGPRFAGVRLIAAAVAAITVALAMGYLTKGSTPIAAPSDSPHERSSPPSGMRLALRSGFGDMVDHTAPWILLGLAVAAIAAPLLQHSWLTRLDPGVGVVIFALLGLPLYVCASASTPLVAILIAGGVSPGAGLALLITGPATNVATLGILTRMHGRRFAIVFAVSMTVTAVMLGFLTNQLMPIVPLSDVVDLRPGSPSLLQLASLIGLAALFTSSLLRRGTRDFLGELRFARAG